MRMRGFFFLGRHSHTSYLECNFCSLEALTRFSVCDTNFTAPFVSLPCLTLYKLKMVFLVFSYINYVKLLTWTNYIPKNLGTQIFNTSFHNCWPQKFGIKAACCWGGMLWLPDWCIIKWSMLGLSGKWCYFNHNLFL